MLGKYHNETKGYQWHVPEKLEEAETYQEPVELHEDNEAAVITANMLIAWKVLKLDIVKIDVEDRIFFREPEHWLKVHKLNTEQEFCNGWVNKYTQIKQRRQNFH